MRSCVFDIETTSLEAVGAGVLLCVGIRPLATGRTRVFRLDQYSFDKSDEYGCFEREEGALLIDSVGELDKYDLLIGHNIDKFDIPFLRSRAYQFGCAWPAHPLTYDTMKAFRRTGFLTRQNGFGKPSAGMDMVADFLGVVQLKTKIYPREWWLSIWGNKAKRTAALDEIERHNQQDVRLNASIYPILLANDPRVMIRRLP